MVLVWRHFTLVQTPSQTTLKKYGLTEQEWRVILERQGGVCFVCRQEPKKGRLCIDHEHVKNWKKMPSDQRKRFVRGLLCWRCNTTFVGRGITVERAQNVAVYLAEHKTRLISHEEKAPPQEGDNSAARRNLERGRIG